MLPNYAPIHLVFLTIAIILEILANVLMKLSKGFKHKLPGIAAIFCVLVAFTALSFAIKGIQLSVAYGIWGGVGLIATALFGIILFDERLRFSGWLGVVFVIIGIVLMRMS
jgi:spermidine export protein MdtI